MNGPHVIVVGGGIAGLAAAYHLLRSTSDVRVTLVEASPRLGGVIHTVREDGYVLEEGPDLFLGAKPGGWDLARSLGISDRLHGTRQGVGGSFVLSEGKLHRLPEGLTGLVPTKLMPFVKTPLVSPLGKLRVALDFFIPPRKDDSDESVESFVVRRLGREMYDRIVEPLLSGIFAGDGSRLSVLATFPHMRAAEREHGGMAKAMLAGKRKEKAARAAAQRTAGGAARPGGGRRPDQWGFLSFPGGLSEMIEALERALAAAPERVRIRTGMRVQYLASLPGGEWRVTLDDGESLDGNAVILATPAFVSSHLMASIDPVCAAAMAEIEFIATATCSIAFRREHVTHPLNGTGWTTPRRERRPVMAMTWTSAKFADRAPQGIALFRAFIGDATNQDVMKRSDAELVRLVREELRTVLGITADPVKVLLRRYDRAMPQYNLGHVERVALIQERVAMHPGLALAGNSYRAVGIPDVIRSGEAAADSVMSSIAALVTGSGAATGD